MNSKQKFSIYIAQCTVMLALVFTGCSSREVSYSLGSSENNTRPPPEQNRYSFDREEFVHPLIVRELLGWISDGDAPVVSIDVESGNQSNQFFSDFTVEKYGGRSWVKWKGHDEESFSYVHVATSPSGVEMVECYSSGGGSGVFGSVALFSWEYDEALREDIGGRLSTKRRLLLKQLGEIALGDRYDGSITYKDGLLTIEPDAGWFERGEDAVKKLRIQ